MSIGHLVVGPEQHGVVAHGTQLAAACGHVLLRARTPSELPRLAGYDVVHVPFTDRLFGRDCAAAGRGFAAVAAAVRDAGAQLSVTLHDVPHDDSPLQQARRELYRHVIGQARGVVVNSRLELSLAEPFADAVHSLRLARLPVPSPLEGDATLELGGPTVGVLGFVYPDRGYEDVLAALPPGGRLLALGRASEGHEDLPARYAAAAPGRWELTGYLPDDELTAHLRSVDVPVAPNRRVTASGSINTWLAHGRRPLVPSCPYTLEVATDRPGTLTVYDPCDPEGLRTAVAAALADPASTWLDAKVDRGPALDDVAGVYREHLEACRPPAPVAVGSGYLVPGNRWDLLAGHEPEPPRVSVVVPYYEAQEQLDRTLAALALQTHRRDRLEVVVADDGSARPPDVACAGALPVQVVRQDDRGFRAGAARNLGASVATGDVLVFLDADTVPEPGFVAALTRLPALCPDAVTVGRRRHADLRHLRPDGVRGWWEGRFAITELPEPGWLLDAYAASADLLDVDRRSYRFVISAVLAMSRRLYHEVGGFDERLIGYGGEDWELAHRLDTAGAVFAHVPAAVAWHDGPDWAGRPEADRPGAKNAESLALALLLPDAAARGGGQWRPYPSVVIRAGRVTATELLAVARTAFASGADVGIWADQVTGVHRELVLADPCLHVGQPPDDVDARALWQVELAAPADLGELPALCEVADRHGEVETPAMRVVSSRARARSRRWADGDAVGDPALLRGRMFGRHDRSAPLPWQDLDLARVLARC